MWRLCRGEQSFMKLGSGGARRMDNWEKCFHTPEDNGARMFWEGS
jgi:hypothetical protein